MPHDPTEVDQPETVREKELAVQIEELERRVRELTSQRDFGLQWEERPEDVERLLVSEIPVLVEHPEHAINDVAGSPAAPHVLIEGDNLHALHVLQATHKDAVDLIYIDPPYNRGSDFRYNDKIIDKDHAYRHSAWLSFMNKRLRLAKALLKPQGLICISIDGIEHARLVLLCEEVFGEKNVIASLAVVNNLKGRSDDKHIATAHEYLVVCARDESQLSIGGFDLDDAKAAEYRFSDSKGRFKPVGLQKTGKGSLRSDRPNMYYPIFWNEASNSLSLTRTSVEDEEILPIFTDGREGRWRWGKETFEAKKSTELIVKRQKKRGPVIYVKMRLESDEGTKRTSRPKSIWIDPKYDSGSATTMLKSMLGTKAFDNPKPLSYIKDILSIGCSKDALIVDFFAGTGTTLHAAAELNTEDDGDRRVILVTNNENEICRQVTMPRIAAALSGDWADGKERDPLQGSLRFFSTGFIGRNKSLDRMRTDIAKHVVELVALIEGTSESVHRSDEFAVLRSTGRTVAVVPAVDANHEQIKGEADALAEHGERVAYLFTWSDSGIEQELVEIWSGWTVAPLPSQMLAALRRTAPQPSLFEGSDEGDAR